MRYGKSSRPNRIGLIGLGSLVVFFSIFGIFSMLAESPKDPDPTALGSLDQILSEVIPPVEKACGRKLKNPPKIQSADGDAIAEAFFNFVKDEFYSNMKVISKEHGLSPSEEVIATRMAKELTLKNGREKFLAFYDHPNNRILVNLPFFQALGSMRNREFSSYRMVRHIVAHELTHAVDMQTTRFLGYLFQTRPKSDERIAMTSLSEGHAQYVAQAVAVALGDMKHFEMMADLVCNPPISRDQFDQSYMDNIFPYEAGFLFFSFLGEGRDHFCEAIEKVRSTDVISHPMKYVDAR